MFTIRRFGGNCCNLKFYDDFVMRELLAAQVGALSISNENIGVQECYLVKPKKPDKRLRQLLVQHNLLLATSECLTAHSCSLANGMVATVGDAILFACGECGNLPFQCGSIQALLELNGLKVALIEEFTGLGYMPTRHAIKFDCTSPKIRLLPCTSIASPVVFSSSKGVLTCLISAHLKV